MLDHPDLRSLPERCWPVCAPTRGWGAQIVGGMERTRRWREPDSTRWLQDSLRALHDPPTRQKTTRCDQPNAHFIGLAASRTATLFRPTARAIR